MAEFDNAYMEALQDTMFTGSVCNNDRTGVGTIKSFGTTIHTPMFNWVDTELKILPALRLRKLGPRIAFEELMWMLRGQTDVQILRDKNIHIWDGNSNRDFLDRRGLTHLPEWDIGKAYGYQMRNFNGVDQLTEVYNSLRDDPMGRRHLISFWNPGDLDEMALPSCHYSYNFVVSNNGNGLTLNLLFNMRSADSILGVPNNMMFAGFWLHMFAQALGYSVGALKVCCADFHIYMNHVEATRVLLHRWQTNKLRIGDPVTFRFNKDLNSLDDILGMEWSDIEMVHYNPLPALSKDLLVLATG